MSRCIPEDSPILRTQEDIDKIDLSARQMMFYKMQRPLVVKYGTRPAERPLPFCLLDMSYVVLITSINLTDTDR